MQKMQKTRYDPWVGKIPWRRKWQLIPVFLPWELEGGAWWATVCRVAKEMDMTERLSNREKVMTTEWELSTWQQAEGNNREKVTTERREAKGAGKPREQGSIIVSRRSENATKLIARVINHNSLPRVSGEEEAALYKSCPKLLPIIYLELESQKSWIKMSSFILFMAALGLCCMQAFSGFGE